MGRGGKEKGASREDEQERGNGYALGQLGHTHGELVDFIYWFLTFLSGSFCFHFPLSQVQQWLKKNPTVVGMALLGQPKAFRALLDGQ